MHWLFKENIFALLGTPAWGSGYQQRRAWFKYCKKREEYPYDSESLCSYFQAIGSEMTSQQKDYEGTTNIYAKFKSFNMMASVVKHET